MHRRKSCRLFLQALDRFIILRNLRLVLKATVSSSALRMGMTAAKGLPRLTTMMGSFRRFSAYSDSGDSFSPDPDFVSVFNPNGQDRGPFFLEELPRFENSRKVEMKTGTHGGGAAEQLPRDL